MQNNKLLFGLGIILLLLGLAAIFFSQLIIEDVLRIERAFGEEPLSLSFVRAGLASTLFGAGLLTYAGWRNRRQKR